MSTTALQNQVAALNITPFHDIKNDCAWRPQVPPGHSEYTWGLGKKSFSTTAKPAAAPAAAPAPAVEAAPAAAPAEAPKKVKKQAAPVVVDEDAEFLKLDLRVGKVTNLRDHADAESLYLFDCLLGEETVQVVTNLKKSMSKEELEGKNLVFLCNLKPTAFRGEKSFAMIMGGASADGAHGLLAVPETAQAGERLHIEGKAPSATVPGRANDKAIAAAFAGLSTNDSCQLTFNGKTVVAGSNSVTLPNITKGVFAAK
jgi:methionine--tRNA ligase beta chain